MSRRVEAYKKDNKIKQLLREKNMTQTRLCELIHVSRSEINAWINHRTCPSLYDVVDIAEALKIPIEQTVLLFVGK